MEWFIDQRRKNLPVSQKSIIKKAKEVGAAIGMEDFSASNGWLWNFLKRNSLTIRRATSISQKAPANVAEKLVAFIRYIRFKRIEHNYPLSKTYGGDEVGVWLDAVRGL